MGRGRAKAKQVKVARQLKYNSGGTNLDRLRAELGVVTDQQDAEPEAAYAEFADRYSVDDDEEDDDDDDPDDDLDDHLGADGLADEAPRRADSTSAGMSRTAGT